MSFDEFKESIEESKQIGVVGSPSTTSTLTVDILEKAAADKLVGELLLFEFEQDEKKNYALGQVTEVQLYNQWLESGTMRSLARQKGYV